MTGIRPTGTGISDPTALVAGGASAARERPPAEVWDPLNTTTISGKAFASAFDLSHAMARDFDGRIVFWSGGLERLYGWSREEAVGRISHELLATEFPRPLSEIEAELRQTGRWQGELTHRARDGRRVIVASSWALQRNEAAQPIWTIECNNDITELKAAEAELRHAKLAAEQAALAKSRMLTTVGHDLKQPLQVLSTTLSMLARDIGATERGRLIARADRSVETLAAALDSLLEAARLESGVLTPRIECFPVKPLLDGLEQQFELAAQQKGLEFRVVASPARVRSDRRMLATILRNLTSNAIKYTERGSVVVSCRESGDGVLSIAVRDTGIGIAPDKLDLIFEEFQRLGLGAGEGLGLGLAIVERTAGALGHPVGVQSAPGFGSTFTVAVPLEEP